MKYILTPRDYPEGTERFFQAAEKPHADINNLRQKFGRQAFSQGVAAMCTRDDDLAAKLLGESFGDRNILVDACVDTDMAEIIYRNLGRAKYVTYLNGLRRNAPDRAVLELPRASNFNAIFSCDVAVNDKITGERNPDALCVIARDAFADQKHRIRGAAFPPVIVYPQRIDPLRLERFLKEHQRTITNFLNEPRGAVFDVREYINRTPS